MQETFTFDDVLLAPQYSEIRPKDAVLDSRLTRHIAMRLPIMSAPMDTVTEHRLAIALALAGGIGVIHKNLTADQQAREVRLVKRFENGFITEPVTVGPDDTIQAVYDIRIKKGYKAAPVVDKEGKLLGLITKLDYFWPHDKDKLVREAMVPTQKLITAPADISLERANDIIYTKKLGVLCLVDAAGRLSVIVTRKDLEKNEMYPQANKDRNKSLRVGAAVSVGEAALERARLLVGSGVNVIVVDVAHGHSGGVIDTVKLLKKDSVTKEVDVIAGNIATAAGAKALIAAGADAVKVGVGPGSICTTRVVAGIGVPQLSAVLEAVKGRGRSKVSIIADGGIRYSGDIVKALAAGADSVMIGGLFAGAEESPGDTEYYQGRMYKSYRGMGSLGAMSHGSADRYGQASTVEATQFVPEGIEGRIQYRGPVAAIIHQLAGGVRAGMAYVGAKTIPQLQQKAEFIKITPAGWRESHPHDIEITKQAPNYS
ncbi:IMP dehydrogenase [Candidatus Falkowbacteria bacterium CG10_big_fil_rev_8_21_14_0_10_44_15]|uniref:Inosine-5'-monophosphate dehydrogenase n=1 Tax=Candidatus Falkowbacteria bacterium CG10_big_fil_rev_8_21_14_0_10_44_15 TaxID=1974569 RepID=A0A2H0V0F0_9BACT|nr:MAG: IMP dehydrogenase [Candidatus Falkowbacteria bacterium CG10_big_fil_rev_8_21_14_0_10_44_15]